MKKTVLFFGILVLFVSNLSSQQIDFSKLTGSYLGQKPPRMIPEIFALGIVSKSGTDEWGLAVNKNWTEIFFSRGENDKASIYHLKKQSGVWTKPKLAAFSGKYDDSHLLMKETNCFSFQNALVAEPKQY